MTLEAALAAADRGWHVFPVLPNEKRPAVEQWEQRATTDPSRIQLAWGERRWNVGLACGPSGLLVVDLDQPEPGDDIPPPPWNMLDIRGGADVLAILAKRARQPWPETYSVRTPSGGQHLYFTAPPGSRLRNTQGRLGWKIDTRTGGGYVLAPGSLIADRAYQPVDPRATVANLPFWLEAQLAPPPAPAGPKTPTLPGERADAYVAAAIRGESDRIRTARRGQHNSTIFISSVALGQLVAGGALGYQDARAALRAAAEGHVASACNCTSREVEATIASGLRAGASRPRGAAA